MPTTKKNPTTSKLINRHAEIEQIGHILDRIKNCKNVTFEGVNYHGLAGIGKSRLIRHIGSLCREKDIPFALVDFEESPLQSHADYLALLASQLGKYQELFTALQAAAQEQINSAMVKTLQDAVNGKQLSIEEEPFVLIHDSCEYCEPGLFDWIGKEFLECINKLLRRPVVFFLAGRGPHVKMSYWPPELSNKVESYYISAFDIAGTKEHIAALDRNGAFRGVEAEIFALSSGHPYCTETVLYHLQKLNVDVRELPKHRKTLALRLYEEVIQQKLMPDEKVWPHENFAISCFPRQFDA
ncbi:MAG: ATP-binding protein, partial [bacterium]